MRKMKKVLSLAMTAAMTASLLTGMGAVTASAKKSDDGKRTKITALLNSTESTEQYNTIWSLTAEEEQQVSTIMSDISTYVQEETIKAITDGAALANWDNTVRQIYSMGIEDALSIYQTGYDRYNDR